MSFRPFHDNNLPRSSNIEQQMFGFQPQTIFQLNPFDIYSSNKNQDFNIFSIKNLDSKSHYKESKRKHVKGGAPKRAKQDNNDYNMVG